MKQEKRPHGVAIPVMLCFALVALTCADGAVVWQEAEGFAKITGYSGDPVRDRLSASGGRVTTGGALGPQGCALEYKVILSEPIPKATVVLRYARLHWREMPPAKAACEVVYSQGIARGSFVFGDTGGWGSSRQDWQLVSVPVGSLGEGAATVIVRSEDSEYGDTVLDGFFIVPEDFRITATELSALACLAIDSYGYTGMDLSYSATRQDVFPGFNVAMRGFVPRETKLAVELRKPEGTPVAMLFEKDGAAPRDRVTRLRVPPDAVRVIDDGEYVLSLSWADGQSELTLPLTAVGRLTNEAESERDRLIAFVRKHGDSSDKAVISAVDDLRYAIDYITHVLTLFRIRRGEDPGDPARDSALKYFEKSIKRSAAVFGEDLRQLVNQSRETTRRMDAATSPYAGRAGALQRAFVSRTGGRLERYRVFIPSSYGQGKKTPMVLALHGGGGDENQFFDVGGGELLPLMEKRGYVMVAPQSSQWYEEDGLKDMRQLVDVMLEEYPEIDASRLYCTGVSRGGWGTYSMLITYPGLFAAGAPVSAGVGDDMKLENLHQTPVLILHGEADTVVPVALGTAAHGALVKIGCPAEIKTFAGYGHAYVGAEYMNLTLDFFDRRRSGEDAAAKQSAMVFREDLVIGEQDRVVLEQFVKHAVTYAEGLTADKVSSQCKKAPEMFAWVEFRYLSCLNLAYERTHDTQYLDLLRDSFAMFRKIMRTGDDEYLGWYGMPIKPRRLADQPDLQIDELQMNFRAMSLLARWVELAGSNQEYAAANSDTIKAHVDLMENHLFPKWDARGHFTRVAGRGGVYHGLDFPIKNQSTLSHEKLSIAVDGLLKLHRVTGNDTHLKRALELGAWFKSNLSLKDGHYEWMSWVPAGQWDVDPTKEDAWSVGWIAPDPNGPWYVASLSIALNLYQHGLLFTDLDLERFLVTQKTMCWNGDMESPEYRTVAGATSKWVKGRFLSYQLSHYDPILQKLAFAGPHEAAVLANAGNSWQGGANAQDYVREKYLMRSVISEKRQPYAAIGEEFLASRENKAFYDALFFEVKAPGAAAPLTPSQMFRRE